MEQSGTMDPTRVGTWKKGSLGINYIALPNGFYEPGGSAAIAAFFLCVIPVTFGSLVGGVSIAPWLDLAGSWVAAPSLAFTLSSPSKWFRSWEYLHSFPRLHVFDLFHSKPNQSGNCTRLTGGLPCPFPLPLGPFPIFGAPFPALAPLVPFLFPFPRAATYGVGCSAVAAAAILPASANTCGSCENRQSFPCWHVPLIMSQQGCFLLLLAPLVPLPPIFLP